MRAPLRSRSPKGSLGNTPDGTQGDTPGDTPGDTSGDKLGVIGFTFFCIFGVLSFTTVSDTPVTGALK